MPVEERLVVTVKNSAVMWLGCFLSLRQGKKTVVDGSHEEPPWRQSLGENFSVFSCRAHNCHLHHVRTMLV